MSRARKTSQAEDRYEQRLEADRVRAQRYRDRAQAIGRPSPAATDRAITMAIRDVWGAHLEAVAGSDTQARAAAMRDGVDLVTVGGRAIEWLCRFERADREQACKMVLARMRPLKRRDTSRNGV